MASPPNPQPGRSRRVPRPHPGRPRASARQAVLAATEALLLEGGSEAVSIRRVSARCGYSAPTIYHHFGDKNGLIDAVLERRFRHMLELMQAIPRGDDAARYLREVAVAFVRFAVANPDHYRLLNVDRAHQSPEAVPSAEAARALAKEALGELLREGTLATPDLEGAFQVLWSMLHGLISLHLLRPDHARADNLVDLALDTVERGLLRRTPK
jgi:AcrR family transcriptional regulator